MSLFGRQTASSDSQVSTDFMNDRASHRGLAEQPSRAVPGNVSHARTASLSSCKLTRPIQGTILSIIGVAAALLSGCSQQAPVSEQPALTETTMETYSLSPTESNEGPGDPTSSASRATAQPVDPAIQTVQRSGILKYYSATNDKAMLVEGVPHMADITKFGQYVVALGVDGSAYLLDPGGSAVEHNRINAISDKVVKIDDGRGCPGMDTGDGELWWALTSAHELVWGNSEDPNSVISYEPGVEVSDFAISTDAGHGLWTVDGEGTVWVCGDYSTESGTAGRIDVARPVQGLPPVVRILPAPGVNGGMIAVSRTGLLFDNYVNEAGELITTAIGAPDATISDIYGELALDIDGRLWIWPSVSRLSGTPQQVRGPATINWFVANVGSDGCTDISGDPCAVFDSDGVGWSIGRDSAGTATVTKIEGFTLPSTPFAEEGDFSIWPSQE